MTLSNRIEQAAEGSRELNGTHFPSKAEFGVGTYSDGSGPVLTVGYDATDQGALEGQVLLDGYTLTIPHENTEEFIAAVRYCAAALKARGR